MIVIKELISNCINFIKELIFVKRYNYKDLIIYNRIIILKKIIILSFIFPPLAGGGVQRTLKFVKYLPQYGYTSYVITTEKSTYGSKDYSLLEEIPDDLKIFRIKSFYLMNLMPKFKLFKINQIISFIHRKCIFPDGSLFWVNKAKIFAEELMLKEKINIIYTTGGPFSTHLAGLYLKLKYPEIKWVADFRDEWTTNPHVKRFFLRRIIEQNMEFKVIENADKIITITDIMAKNIIDNYLKISKNKKRKINTNNIIDKFRVISNGYDEEDFKDIKVSFNISHSERKLLKIGYNGGMYNKRNPYYFLKSISELIDEKIVNKKKIKIYFSGYRGILIKKPLIKFKLNDIVVLKGYLKHIESLNFMNQMDLLLLIIGNFKGAESIVTGKIFEYLRLGKPIFMLGPENGIAWKLIQNYGIGYRCDVDDADCIKKTLIKIYEDYFNNKMYVNKSYLSKKIDFDKLKIFERKNLTRKLSNLLDEITAT